MLPFCSTQPLFTAEECAFGYVRFKSILRSERASLLQYCSDKYPSTPHETLNARAAPIVFPLRIVPIVVVGVLCGAKVAMCNRNRIERFINKLRQLVNVVVQTPRKERGPFHEMRTIQYVLQFFSLAIDCVNCPRNVCPRLFDRRQISVAVVKLRELRVEGSLDFQSLRAKAKIDELRVHLPLMEVCSLHGEYGPRGRRNGGDASEERLEVINDVSPPIATGLIGNTPWLSKEDRRKQRTSRNNGNKPYPSRFAISHPIPPRHRADDGSIARLSVFRKPTFQANRRSSINASGTVDG